MDTVRESLTISRKEWDVTHGFNRASGAIALILSKAYGRGDIPEDRDEVFYIIFPVPLNLFSEAQYCCNVNNALRSLECPIRIESFKSAADNVLVSLFPSVGLASLCE